MQIIYLIISFIFITQSLTCEQKNQLLWFKLIRGDYLELCRNSRKGLISNARQQSFAGNLYNRGPLRDQIYYVMLTTGILTIPTTRYMQIDFMQSYMINKLILWIYDVAASGTVTISIDIITKEGKIINIYPTSLAYRGILKLKFDAVRVKSLRINNKQGSGFSIIKIQTLFDF